MFVAQPIEWTDRGVVMLDQSHSFFSVIPSGATRLSSRCYLSCS